jgi:hypothetical protein
MAVEEKVPGEEWGIRDFLEGHGGDPSWAAKAQATLRHAALAPCAALAAAEGVIWVVCTPSDKIAEFAVAKDDLLAWVPGQPLTLLSCSGSVPATVAALPRKRHPIWAFMESKAVAIVAGGGPPPAPVWPAGHLLLVRKAAEFLLGQENHGDYIKKALAAAQLSHLTAGDAKRRLPAGAAPKDKRHHYVVLADLETAYSGTFPV